MSDSSEARMNRFDRFRWWIARMIMPNEVIERERRSEDRFNNLINEMHFNAGALIGFRKGMEIGKSSSDYRVDEELR